MKALGPQARRCVVAHMNNACARFFEQSYENESADGLAVLFVRRHLAGLRKSANDFLRAECRGAPLSESQQKLLAALTNRLHDSLHAE